MKNKGFTMVELLATITILGIISLLAIGGYMRYQYQAQEKAVEVLLSSAASAAEEFVMDNPGASVRTKIETKDGEEYFVLDQTDPPRISFETLLEERYLSSAVDPASRETTCKGYVTIGLVKGEVKGALDQYIYVVDLCCPSTHMRRTYTYKKELVPEDEAEEEGEFRYISKKIDDLNNYECD